MHPCITYLYHTFNGRVSANCQSTVHSKPQLACHDSYIYIYKYIHIYYISMCVYIYTYIPYLYIDIHIKRSVGGSRRIAKRQCLACRS